MVLTFLKLQVHRLLVLLLLVVFQLDVVFQSLILLPVLDVVSQHVPPSRVTLFKDGLVPEVRHHGQAVDLVLDVLEFQSLEERRHHV